MPSTSEKHNIVERAGSPVSSPQGAVFAQASAAAESTAKRPSLYPTPCVFSGGALVLEEGILLRRQSNELGKRFACRLVLDFSDHLFVGLVEELARIVEC